MDVTNFVAKGTMPLDGRPTAVKEFGAFPGTIFFGLEKKSLVGTAYSLKVKFQTHEINVDNAHSEQITDIQYTNINGQHIFFTCSLDSMVKAWTPTADGLNLTCALQN